MAGTFTDRQIRNLKPESKTKDTRIGQGFGIRVKPDGTKIFFYGYNSPISGTRRFLTLGEYPGLSLENARIKYSEAFKMVKGGRDPLEIKQLEAEERLKAPTVADFADEYMERHGDKKKSGMQDRRTLDVEIIPKWGNRKVKDIKRREVGDLLEKIAKRPAPIMANRTRALLSKFFNFAIEREVIQVNPCAGTKPLVKETPRKRHLSEDEIREVWKALSTPGTLHVSDEISRCLKLILLTGQRPGEVVGMESKDIEGNWWTIPDTKNGMPHSVFLTPTAKDLIGNKAGYIFESPRKSKNTGAPQSMHVNALAHAVRDSIEEPNEGAKLEQKTNVGDKPKTTRRKLIMPAWTPHDLRRTAATKLSELGIMDEVIDVIQNHKKVGVVRIYNQNPYEREKQQALEAWDRKLVSIINGTKCNVTPMIRKANN